MSRYHELPRRTRWAFCLAIGIAVLTIVLAFAAAGSAS